MKSVSIVQKEIQKRDHIRELDRTKPNYFDFLVPQSRSYPSLFVTICKNTILVFSFPACKLVKKYWLGEDMQIEDIRYFEGIQSFVACIQTQIIVFSLSSKRIATFTLEKTKRAAKLSMYIETKTRGKYLYFAGDFDGLYAWNFETQKEEENNMIPLEDQIGYLQYVKSYDWLIAAGASSGQLYIIEMEENNFLMQIPVHGVDSRITLSYSIQSDGFHLVTCNGQNQVRQWMIDNDAGSFELTKDQKISQSRLTFIVAEYNLVYCLLQGHSQGIKLDLETLKVIEEDNRHKSLCQQLKKYFYRISQ